MQKQPKLKVIPKTKKSTSNKTSAIYKDVLDLIHKHSGIHNINFTQLSPQSDNKEGFFLIFIKRDESLGEDKRLAVTTFGQYITLEDLVASVSNVIEQTIESAKNINYV